MPPINGLRDRPPTIYGDALTCDEIRRRAGQKDYNSLDFFQLPPSSHRGALNDKVIPLLVFLDLFDHFCFEISRRNSIDLDP